MKMPLSIGVIHFIGIGGIGMSGIAEALHNLGYKVQGSDQSDNANTMRLRKQNIPIFIGHRIENLENSEVVVISSAIKADNCEYRAAKSLGLPIVKRAEMLAELMRFRQAIAVGGTHGKTTTTSLIAAILEASDFDPTVINGGIINAYGTNSRLGQGNWMVVEADESDGSFLKLPVDVTVVTNIDAEHLEFYGTFENLLDAFRKFIENVPFYGFNVLCIDHEEVQKLAGRIHDRKIITYGENLQADVQFLIKSSSECFSHFDVIIKANGQRKEKVLKNLVLSMPGRHNVSNAVAAIAVANELGIDEEAIHFGLKNFKGVKRRFTFAGEWQGVKIFDDYGHHPIEIQSVLKAARENVKNHVIAIVQPHRYSRLCDLFEDFSTSFNDADIVIILPVYSAGEDPIDDIDSEKLVEKIKINGHRNAHYISHQKNLAPFIYSHAQSGDFVVFLGAGNITQWSYLLAEELDILSKNKKK